MGHTETFFYLENISGLRKTVSRGETFFPGLYFYKMRAACSFFNISDTLTAVSLLKAEAAIFELKLLSQCAVPILIYLSQ